jgi:hypothetical protein
MLWQEFRGDFKDTFTDSTAQQDAQTALKNHKMVGDDLDTYIVRFEELAEKAGWEVDALGTVEQFRMGLKLPLQRECFRHEPCPRTYLDWKETARIENARYALMKSAGVIGTYNPAQTARREKFQKFLHGKGSGQHKGSDKTVHMQVDSAKINAMSPEEKKHHLENRLCFRCHQSGHMAKKCPTRGDSGRTPNSGRFEKDKTFARVTEVVDDRDTVTTEAPPYDGGGQSKTYEEEKKAIVGRIKAMNADDRLTMYEEIMELDQDF